MICSTFCFIALLAASEIDTLEKSTLLYAQESTPRVTPNSTIHDALQTDITLLTHTVLDTTSVVAQVFPPLLDEPEKTPASITITNNITPSMLNYKHWTGTYTPEQLTICLNGTEIALGESYVLTATESPLIVDLSYSFMNGMRKGSKKVSYCVHKNVTTASLSFSWSEDHKVIIDNATPILVETT